MSMGNALRLAVAGLGNNLSALIQGVHYYRKLVQDGANTSDLPGIRHYQIGGMSICDIKMVCAFDIQEQKIGKQINAAIFESPNNYPSLGVISGQSECVVSDGLRLEGTTVRGREAVVRALRSSSAEVLLYSLPTGLQWAADAYAECALEAGVGFVNCTPETVARNKVLADRFAAKGLSVIGDDLASHMGTSMLHRAILNLLLDRGLDLENTYQLNLGGNEDFRNLREKGSSKATSKKNALARQGLDTDRVHIIPSAGYVPHLADRKVAYLNVVGRGWANTPVLIDLKLEVQDSSNAAGVIIDLVRIAGATQRDGRGGFNPAAGSFLKSPPNGHSEESERQEQEAFAILNQSDVAELA